jgi:ERF superfamily
MSPAAAAELLTSAEAARAFALARLDPQALLAAAIQQGAGIDVVERLVALAKDVNAAEARAQWYAAMARFQRAAPSIGKSGAARLRREAPKPYAYATLEDIVGAVREALTAEGLSVGWRTRMEGNAVVVACHVAHQAGHREDSGELALPTGIAQGSSMNAAQAVGSAMTYARRYTLLAMLGLQPEGEDDDGAGAGEPEAAAPRPEPELPPVKLTGNAEVDERNKLTRQLHQYFRERRMGSAERTSWLREAFADVPLERVELAQLRLAVEATGKVISGGSELMRVPLTPEEMLARGQELAALVRDLELLDIQHKEQRESAAEERKELLADIKRLAQAVRTGSEDREAQIGLFP